MNISADLLPWLNLLLVPIVKALWSIHSNVSEIHRTQAAVEVRLEEHQRRLARLESGLADLA